VAEAIVKAFTPTGTTTLEAVSTTSASEAITGFDDTSVVLDRQVRIMNIGPNRAFVAKGDSSVAAAIPTDAKFDVDIAKGRVYWHE
jgi:uncharacterized protein YcfL